MTGQIHPIAWRRTDALAVAALLSGLSLAPAAAGAAALTPQEERGKVIYHEGASPAGRPITALVGRNGIRVPGAALPCANCHGPDGLGRPEGGVEPTDVTWGYLTKSYGHHHPNRRHVAFDEKSLAVAINSGIDPSFNPFDPAMPRYEMAEADLRDLVAYLKRLEGDLDPGLRVDAVRVGALLAREGRFAPAGRAVEAALAAYFAEVNSAGGVHGRRIELVVAEYSEDFQETRAAARRLAEEAPVFATVASFAFGFEAELFPYFEAHGVPQVGPLTLFGPQGHPEDGTFFLLSGLPTQARALVDYMVLNLGLAPGPTALLLGPGPAYDVVAEAVRDQLVRRAWPEPVIVRFAGGWDEAVQRAAALRRAGVGSVFYFASGTGLANLARAAVAARWLPRLFLAGPLSARAALGLPAAFDGRVFLAYPNVPADQSPGGREELARLRGRYGLPEQGVPSQIQALAAAKVLVEGLSRAGRALSRAKLVAALEGLEDYETGFVPALSFGPNARIGARGAHVLALDLARGSFRAAPVWVAP